MKILHTIALVIVAAFLAGCTALQSEYYPGEKISDFNNIIPRESVWLAEEECALHIHVTASNELVVAGLDWEGNNSGYKKESLNIVLSRLDDQFFVSFKEDADDECYIITRLILPYIDEGLPKHAIILNINEETFKEDASNGDVLLLENECCGKKTYETFLTGSKEEQDEYFRNNPNTLWDLKSATVIRRITMEQN